MLHGLPDQVKAKDLVPPSVKAKGQNAVSGYIRQRRYELRAKLNGRDVAIPTHRRHRRNPAPGAGFALIPYDPNTTPKEGTMPLDSNTMPLFDPPGTAIADPRVFVREGAIYANSQDVADYFGKEHRNVLRDIDHILAGCSDLSGLENQRLAGMFAAREVWVEKANTKVRTFDMTRDGFALVVMGYTGPKAMGFKLRYIDRFNRMETELKAAAGPVVPRTMSGALRLAAEQQEQLEAQAAELVAKDQVIASQAEDVAVVARLEASDGSFNLNTTAKMLDYPPRKLTRLMAEHRWIYGSRDRVAYQAKITAGLLEHSPFEIRLSNGDIVTKSQVLVTPKGLAALAKLIGKVAA